MTFGDKVFITDRCDFLSIRGKEGIFVCYHNENGLCKVVIKDEKDFFFLWEDEILLLKQANVLLFRESSLATLIIVTKRFTSVG